MVRSWKEKTWSSEVRDIFAAGFGETYKRDTRRADLVKICQEKNLLDAGESLVNAGSEAYVVIAV